MKIANYANDHLDSFDRKILSVVSRNARITVTELSNQIGLSKTPCMRG